MMEAYFKSQVDSIAERWLDDIETLQVWEQRRLELRRQLLEMLGIWPLPEKTDLKPTITGRIEHEDFIVEKLYFQSMPGLYVTANLYIPRKLEHPLPAVLYVCGHGNVKKDGVSYGSKTHYQHHPAWFARHGYVSMIIDTLQLGEIEGLHHGTTRAGMWWWINRGYTPAGVEAWNSIRALDYLQSRPEVNPEKLGVTGRSGGGAYSWWLAALDDRVQATVPVAGITDLENHVVDDAIEGHCDCMYMINTYCWDFPTLAALVAPRPLLLSNSDKDRIFPLDGVTRVYWKLRQIYDLYGAADRLGLLVTEGTHQDTQDLRIPAFHWMNRWLKGQDELIDKPAVKFFEPEQLKVFAELPADQVNTSIHEVFVPKADAPKLPSSAAEWQQLRSAWLQALKEKSFGGWPQVPESLNLNKVFELEAKGLQLSVYEFISQQDVPLRLWLLQPQEVQNPQSVSLRVLDEQGWQRWKSGISAAFPGKASQIVGPGFEESSAEVGVATQAENIERLQERLSREQAAIVLIAPRGIGPTAWPADKDKHLLRRFPLIGQTLDGMRVWDVRRAIEAVRTLPHLKDAAVRLQARGSMAGIVLYASLFESGIDQLDVRNLPSTHRDGPIFLNVSKLLDMPQALALALDDTSIMLSTPEAGAWSWPQSLIQALKMDSSRLRIRSSR